MSSLSKDYDLADEPPATEVITDYDRQHFAIYLSLLYANGEGEQESEICRKILQIDPEQEPDRSRKVLASHMKRARWLAESGYHLLLQE